MDRQQWKDNSQSSQWCLLCKNVSNGNFESERIKRQICLQLASIHNNHVADENVISKQVCKSCIAKAEEFCKRNTAEQRRNQDMKAKESKFYPWRHVVPSIDDWGRRSDEKLSANEVANMPCETQYSRSQNSDPEMSAALNTVLHEFSTEEINSLSDVVQEELTAMQNKTFPTGYRDTQVVATSPSISDSPRNHIWYRYAAEGTSAASRNGANVTNGPACQPNMEYVSNARQPNIEYVNNVNNAPIHQSNTEYVHVPPARQRNIAYVNVSPTAHQPNIEYINNAPPVSFAQELTYQHWPENERRMNSILLERYPNMQCSVAVEELPNSPPEENVILYEEELVTQFSRVIDLHTATETIVCEEAHVTNTLSATYNNQNFKGNMKNHINGNQSRANYNPFFTTSSQNQQWVAFDRSDAAPTTVVQMPTATVQKVIPMHYRGNQHVVEQQNLQIVPERPVNQQNLFGCYYNQYEQQSIPRNRMGKGTISTPISMENIERPSIVTVVDRRGNGACNNQWKNFSGFPEYTPSNFEEIAALRNSQRFNAINGNDPTNEQFQPVPNFGSKWRQPSTDRFSSSNEERKMLFRCKSCGNILPIGPLGRNKKCDFCNAEQGNANLQAVPQQQASPQYGVESAWMSCNRGEQIFGNEYLERPCQTVMRRKDTRGGTPVPILGRKFENQQNASRNLHMLRNYRFNPVMPFICHICSESYFNKVILENHIRNVHGLH